jgi:cell division protein FtsW (lipid II flippase)
MSSEEKRAWIMLVVAIGGYLSYLAIILARAGDAPLADVSYVATMLWTIGGAIVVSIVLNILVGIFSPRSAGKKDERDREISRFGEYTGQAFLVIGGVVALILAMAEIPHFWIANAVYLAFVLSAVLGSVAKVVAYRRGLPTW